VNREQFQARTKSFALCVVQLIEMLPADQTSRTLGLQLLRSGTSVGANYRAAARAKSRADFIAKMGNVEEECDEAIYWFELLVASGRIPEADAKEPMREASEILAMTIASINTARLRAGVQRSS
jgi:four helix bundle protein